MKKRNALLLLILVSVLLMTACDGITEKLEETAKKISWPGMVATETEETESENTEELMDNDESIIDKYAGPQYLKIGNEYYNMSNWDPFLSKDMADGGIALYYTDNATRRGYSYNAYDRSYEDIEVDLESLYKQGTNCVEILGLGFRNSGEIEQDYYILDSSYCDFETPFGIKSSSGIEELSNLNNEYFANIYSTEDRYLGYAICVSGELLDFSQYEDTYNEWVDEVNTNGGVGKYEHLSDGSKYLSERAVMTSVASPDVKNVQDIVDAMRSQNSSYDIKEDFLIGHAVYQCGQKLESGEIDNVLVIKVDMDKGKLKVSYHSVYNIMKQIDVSFLNEKTINSVRYEEVEGGYYEAKVLLEYKTETSGYFVITTKEDGEEDSIDIACFSYDEEFGKYMVCDSDGYWIQLHFILKDDGNLLYLSDYYGQEEYYFQIAK